MSNSLHNPLIKGIPIGTVAPTHLLAVGADPSGDLSYKEMVAVAFSVTQEF